MECGAALHWEGRARVMREHKNRNVIRRLLPPPAFPGIVRPGAAHRAEHVTAEDPSPDVVEGLKGHLVIGAPASAVLAVHLFKDFRRKKPLKHFRASYPEGILQALARPRAKP